MTLLIRLLFIALFAVASPARAGDKPLPKPDDARRAALLKAGYTAVPLTFDPKNFCFYVDGALETEKVKIFIDSGCLATVIDTKVAKALKLKLGKESASQGLGGKWTGQATEFSDLHIGPYETGKDWTGMVAEAGDLSGWRGQPGAVIGMNILEPWAAVIDYYARTLYLRPTLVSAWPRLAGTWEVTIDELQSGSNGHRLAISFEDRFEPAEDGDAGADDILSIRWSDTSWP